MFMPYNREEVVEKCYGQHRAGWEDPKLLGPLNTGKRKM